MLGDKRAGIMKDIIDQRDERARIQRSIVKSWNVNYMPASQPELDAAEAFKRFEEANAVKEAARQAEIDAALARADAQERAAAYNATASSYSGDYGRTGVSDEETKGRIDKILHEKADAIRNLVAGTESGEA
ncbi:MAG: hypothetical protein ACLT3H_10010 [Roseburia sp.]